MMPETRTIDRRRLLGCVTAAVLGIPAVGRGQGRSAGPDWLSGLQRAPAELPSDAPQLASVLVDPDGRPIRDLEGWSHVRAELRKWWLDFLGPLPRRTGQPVPALEILDEDRLDGLIRRRVGYESHPGWPTEAYLLLPAETASPRPGVAVFHSTVAHSIRQPAGLEGRPEVAFGLKLARRGHVTFCPRNFLWPDNHTIAGEAQTRKFHEQFPDSKGMAKMLADAILAVDILTSLPEVDATRIGAVGHSLGAKEVLYLAALDERVQVTVSSEGGIGTQFSNWDAPWYLGPTINRAEFQREHHELLSLVAPRAFLLLGGDSADGDRSWPFIEAALPVYELYDDMPRIGFFNHREGHSMPPAAEQAVYRWLEGL